MSPTPAPKAPFESFTVLDKRDGLSHGVFNDLTYALGFAQARSAKSGATQWVYNNAGRVVRVVGGRLGN